MNKLIGLLFVVGLAYPLVAVSGDGPVEPAGIVLSVIAWLFVLPVLFALPRRNETDAQRARREARIAGLFEAAGLLAFGIIMGGIGIITLDVNDAMVLTVIAFGSAGLGLLAGLATVVMSFIPSRAA